MKSRRSTLRSRVGQVGVCVLAAALGAWRLGPGANAWIPGLLFPPLVAGFVVAFGLKGRLTRRVAGNDCNADVIAATAYYEVTSKRRSPWRQPVNLFGSSISWDVTIRRRLDGQVIGAYRGDLDFCELLRTDLATLDAATFESRWARPGTEPGTRP